jgi:hypothetical protein
MVMVESDRLLHCTVLQGKAWYILSDHVAVVVPVCVFAGGGIYFITGGAKLFLQ